MNMLDIIVAISVTGIFFLLLSLIIREVVEFFKIEHNTFQKSFEISSVVSLLALLQFFLSSVPLLVYLIFFMMITLMFIMIKRLYGLTLKKSLLVSLSVIGTFLIFVAILAYILLMFM